MGETEEVEGFRLPLAPFSTVFDGETPELNESSFPLVQLKAELQEPLRGVVGSDQGNML